MNAANALGENFESKVPTFYKVSILYCIYEFGTMTKHYEKSCIGMNSFRNGMNLFRSRMNSFRSGMKSFQIDTGIWGNEKCQKIKLFM